MGANDSHSPARRPQNERSTSAVSLSRASPSDGALAKSHKGSSRQLKAHAVGHGRHPHTRVPSYGKGLHKLSKLGPGNTAEATGRGKTHTRSASDTPSTSPVTPDFKRSSSGVNLSRSGSKVAVKKNHSHASLARNATNKSEKAQTKANLRKKETDLRLNGTAKFELGDDDQDDEWTEDSSSPYTTRQNSAAPSRPKTPVVRDPPSPDYSQDDPPDESLTNLPHSPPESPNPERSNGDLRPGKQRNPSNYDPPDPQLVTNRLLSRNGKHSAPLSETSNVSASITPVRPSSPSDNYGSVAVAKEQSMPVNGISRFLNASGSGTGSVTPGSVSHLQSNLAHLGRDGDPNTHTNNRRSQHPSVALLQKPPPQNIRSESSAKLTRTRSSISTPSPPSLPPHAQHTHPPRNSAPLPSNLPAAPTHRQANPSLSSNSTSTAYPPNAPTHPANHTTTP